MELKEFFEYAKVIEKYKKVLDYFEYYIDVFCNDECSMILLTTENMFGESMVLFNDFDDYLSPEELEEKINKNLVELYNIYHNE